MLPRPRLIGFVAEFTVAVFLIPELAFAVGGLVTVLAARFVAVAVLVTGFIAGLTLAVSRFVAELAARFVECRAVVCREMGIVGGPLTGPLAGRLLRIGSITL